jgi:magnesium-protoporphyrin IX monomethyl ester (oxidative) cyclase
MQKLPWMAVIMWQLLRLYLLPGVDTEATRQAVY